MVILGTRIFPRSGASVVVNVVPETHTNLLFHHLVTPYSFHFVKINVKLTIDHQELDELPILSFQNAILLVLRSRFSFFIFVKPGGIGADMVDICVYGSR